VVQHFSKQEDRVALKNRYFLMIPLLILVGMFVYANQSKSFLLETIRTGMAIPKYASNGSYYPISSSHDKRVANDAGIVAAPAAAAKPVTNSSSIPILMYHEIGEGPNSLFVSVDGFRAHMRYLRANNYHIVTMAQAREMLVKKQIPPKTAVITFDDGYVSFYTKAWPILQECGFPATVYVIAGYPGVYSNYLTWDQIKIIQSGGIEIGSHSVTHPALTTLNADGLTREILGSKEILEARLGVKVNSFCYPTGAYNQQTIDCVKKAGYTSAVTVVYRKAAPSDDLFLIPRIRVFKAATTATLAQGMQ